MVTLLSLWLPILLSAVFVFIASSVIHMALKYHDSDYGKLPDEGRVRDALRSVGAKAGFYMLPNNVGKEWNDPALMEDIKRGPNAFVTVLRDDAANMGKTLVIWFLNCLLVSVVVALVAAATLAPGTEYMNVFCVVALVAFAGYALSEPTQSIWFHRPWIVTAKHMFDGLVFALLTAGTFGWLWPG